MIRLFLTILLLLNMMNLHADTILLKDLRLNYPKAIYDAKLTDALYEKLKSKNLNPTELAYAASIDALKAKHAWNPYSKFEYLNQFDKKITEAVKLDSKNIEIRYLRYSIQKNIPAFVGFNKNIAEDQKAIVNLFLTEKFTKEDVPVLKMVYDYMQDSKSITVNEQKSMLEVLKKI